MLVKAVFMHYILTENVIRKFWFGFVPRYLTAKMRACRMNSSQENLEIFERLKELLLQNIVTMNLAPLSLYIPETECES